jgi:hypothetical protein
MNRMLFIILRTTISALRSHRAGMEFLEGTTRQIIDLCWDGVSGRDRSLDTAVMSPIISLSLAISHRLVPDQILYCSNDTQIGSCVTGDRNA